MTPAGELREAPALVQSDTFLRSPRLWDVSQPPEYPFTPKSNRWLTPGQFWAVSLPSGRFACGRVLLVPAQFGARTSLVAGLMDWLGPDPPRAINLVGRGLLDVGSAHIKTITSTGGAILGTAPLPPEAAALTADLDALSTWGYAYIERLAADRLDEIA